jgi:uncharacterized membrane protein YqhA
LFFLASFVFPFDGVSPETAEGLKQKLASIVAQILDVPLSEVDLVISEMDGDALLTFFICSLISETKKLCEFEEMPSKLKKALKSDDEISKILPMEASMILRSFFFFA